MRRVALDVKVPRFLVLERDHERVLFNHESLSAPARRGLSPVPSRFPFSESGQGGGKR